MTLWLISVILINWSFTLSGAVVVKLFLFSSVSIFTFSTISTSVFSNSSSGHVYGTRKSLFISGSDLTSTRNSYLDNKISDRRSLVSQFISDNQANKLIEALKLKDSHFTEQYNGTYVYGCEQLLYGYGESQASPSSSRGHKQQRMSRHLRSLVKNFLEVSIKISDHAEIFFGMPLQVESCVFNIRKLPGLTQYLPFANAYNVSRWTHGVHVDQCQLDFSFKDRVECRKNDQFKANRHFTAILYLHEVEGGNFAFVDLPKNHSYRSLTDIPAPSNMEIKEELDKRRRRRNLSSSLYSSSSSSPSPSVLPPSLSVENLPESSQYFLTREGLFTVVPPAAGKLVLFTSGVENMHGVTDLLGPVRYTLSLWFTRMHE